MPASIARPRRTRGLHHVGGTVPTTAERGYGPEHKRQREAWRPFVETGQAICWRCNHLIPGHAPWDLGHDEVDRSIYRGPEHRRCNRGSTARLRELRRTAAQAFRALPPPKQGPPAPYRRRSWD